MLLVVWVVAVVAVGKSSATVLAGPTAFLDENADDGNVLAWAPEVGTVMGGAVVCSGKNLLVVVWLVAVAAVMSADATDDARVGGCNAGL